MKSLIHTVTASCLNSGISLCLGLFVSGLPARGGGRGAHTTVPPSQPSLAWLCFASLILSSGSSWLPRRPHGAEDVHGAGRKYQTYKCTMHFKVHTWITRGFLLQITRSEHRNYQLIFSTDLPGRRGYTCLFWQDFKGLFPLFCCMF